MTRKTFNLIFLIILVAGDIFSISSSFILAYNVRFFAGIDAPYGIPPFSPYLNALGFVIITSLLVFRSTGMYKEKRIHSFLDEFYVIFLSLCGVTIVCTSATFIYRGFEYSRGVLIIGFLFSLITVNMFRIGVYKFKELLRKKGIGVENVITVGDTPQIREFSERIKKHPELGYNLVENINEKDIKEVLTVVEKHFVSEIFLPLSFTSREDVQDIMTSDNLQGVKFTFVPDAYEMMTTRFKMGEIEGIPLILLEDIPLKGINAVIKRCMDIVISFFAIIFTSPFFLIICFLIKYSRYSTPGPAILKQERVGLNGKVFTFYKFRTMIVDAEKETGPVWAKENDERRTKIGIFLRKTSLDELPQLINVLKGEMSLVGPRPERPFFVEKFKKEVKRYSIRHKVKPGITGWAQINELRGNADINLRTQYDLYYIENWSLFFDIKIILRTCFEVLFHKTAY